MEEILRVEALSKTFTLSKKQQKIERTTDKKKVAVDSLSFTANRGEIFGLLGPMVLARLPHYACFLH